MTTEIISACALFVSAAAFLRPMMERFLSLRAERKVACALGMVPGSGGTKYSITIERGQDVQAVLQKLRRIRAFIYSSSIPFSTPCWGYAVAEDGSGYSELRGDVPVFLNDPDGVLPSEVSMENEYQEKMVAGMLNGYQTIIVGKLQTEDGIIIGRGKMSRFKANGDLIWSEPIKVGRRESVGDNGDFSYTVSDYWGTYTVWSKVVSTETEDILRILFRHGTVWNEGSEGNHLTRFTDGTTLSVHNMKAGSRVRMQRDTNDEDRLHNYFGKWDRKYPEWLSKASPGAAKGYKEYFVKP